MEVREILRENLRVNFSLDCTGDSPKTRRGLQHLFEIKPKDCSLKSEYETLLSHAIQAEKMCPGSGLIFLRLIVGETGVLEKTKTRKLTDVLREIESKKFSPFVKSLLIESLRLSTFNTKISIRKSSTSKSYIEASEGYSFDLISLLKTTSVEILDSKVVCIDGFIESVSEIHHLLTSLSENKTPCAIFSRGMSNDVLSTLKVNNDRKTVVTFPFAVPFDVENVNTLVDIAVASCSDVVSSTKGDLISSSVPLGSVERMSIHDSHVRIKNSRSKSSVDNHVRNLKKICEERQEVSEILSKRIKSLSSSCVDISIPEDINYYSNTQQLDEGIRVISSIINNSYDPVLVAEKYFDSYLQVMNSTSRCLLL